MFSAKKLVHRSVGHFGGEPRPFGHAFAPFMFEVDAFHGVWGTPAIVPFHNVSLPPQCAALNYGTQCFEGIKAFCDASNGLRLFRPAMNVARFRRSMERLCLPSIDEAELLECIKQLVLANGSVVPQGRRGSLYLRPVALGTNENLGVGPSDMCKMYVIASPVGPYFAGGFKPIRLMVDSRYHRTWEGGTGAYKIGANYAAGMYNQEICRKSGYHQMLWLGAGDVVDEAGSMNVMCLWRNERGERELVTPSLDDGTILPGVTRDSILALARTWNECAVSERRFTVHDLIAAVRAGTLEEMFACGTAAVVCGVDGFNFNGTHYDVPVPPESKSVAKRMLDTIQDIQYGDVPHEWSVPVGQRPA